MRPLITPPARVKTGDGYWMPAVKLDVTAWDIVHEVASNYRYKYSLVGEIKRDLLRFASLKGAPVYLGVKRGTPFFYFQRGMADAWLDDGGRAWIVAELEARSTKRVVPFPKIGGAL